MNSGYLKDGYQNYLWAFVVLNTMVFWSILVLGEGVADAWSRFSKTAITSGAFALLGPIVSLVMNGLLSPTAKARIVFFRWTYPLPGYRAFSKYAATDHRIDTNQLPETPSSPEEENRVWYTLFKEVEQEPSVEGAHSAFLFSRDLAAFAFVFLIAFGACALFYRANTGSIAYLAFLIVQYGVMAVAAGNYGRRFVTNVLAIATH